MKLSACLPTTSSLYLAFNSNQAISIICFYFFHLLLDIKMTHGQKYPMILRAIPSTLEVSRGKIAVKIER